MKKICIGYVNDFGDVSPLYIRAFIKNGELSITGSYRSAAGQIVMHEWDMAEYAPGWDAEKVAKLRAIWARWHLNYRRAGTPAQEQYLREHSVYGGDTYSAACAALAAAGLNPDNGYRYGHAWIREELPQDVIDYIAEINGEPA